MDKLFRQVSVKERFPGKDGAYISCSSIGLIMKRNFSLKHGSFIHNDYHGNIVNTINTDWWLEEVEMPSEEEIMKLKPLGDNSEIDIYDSGFYNGVNYILNKLKGI